MALSLVVGDKNYSSWSLRAALAIDLAGVPYDEVRVRLFQAETRAQLLQYSPAGKVPVLVTEEGPIWDSLAIGEYLAERFAEARLWPRREYARALARSVCAEMHSGFVALRTHMPMDLQRDRELERIPDEVAADIARICRIWEDCRTRFGQEGDFLFGRPTLADAFFAPVASRLRSYRVALPAVAAAYVESIHNWPAFLRWQRAAHEERESVS